LISQFPNIRQAKTGTMKGHCTPKNRVLTLANKRRSAEEAQSGSIARGAA
jgi:hypothetical protein